MPIIRSLSTAAAASVLPIVIRDNYLLLSLMIIGKPEAAAAAVYRLLMMGIRMPETC